MNYITNPLNFCLNKIRGGVLFLLIFLPSLVLAQETDNFYCATEISIPSLLGYSGSIDPDYLATFPQRNFNIYFWDIQDDNGASSPRIPNEYYAEAVDEINSLFQEAGICFTLKGHQVIKNSEFTEIGYREFKNLVTFTKDNNLYVDNAINVFLFNIIDAAGSGGSQSISINKWNFYNDKKGVLAHELGHSFGLMHTFYEGVDCEFSTRDENDPNFNATYAGDWIVDTNPTPDFAQEQFIYGARALSYIGITDDEEVTEILNNNGFAQHPRANEIETVLSDVGFTQTEIDYLKTNPYKKYAYLDENTREYTGVLRTNVLYYNYMFKNCDSTPFINFLTPDDIGNVMGYTRRHFRNVFTIGQAIFMHETFQRTNYSWIDSISSNHDLFIRNSIEDIGTEPDLNSSNNNLWDSPDIWVRNLNNGLLNQEHQEPIYYGYGNNTNYVYVRVTNRSCKDYDGSDAELELTWSKTSLFKNAFLLNSQIDDSHYFNNLIDKVEIPAIPAGESIILSIPWAVPNPDDFDASINNFPFLNIMNLNWGYTLFAKINSNSDPLHSTHQLNMFKNNNNLAAKNVKIIDMSEGFPLDPPNGQLPGTIVGIGNHLEEISQSFHYSFTTNPVTNLWEEAEIIISMDELIWNKWEEGEFRSENIEIYNPDLKQVIIRDNNAKLKNLHFNPGEWGLIHVGFNFLTQEVEHDYYDYSISQQDANDNSIANTTIKLIRDNTRVLFKAESDYEWSAQAEAYVLKAQSIQEDAKYNWYAPNGDLIASNIESILPIDAKGTYKLEVISEDDSYKDYDELTINEIYGITSISPNPATTQVNVVYKTPNLSTDAVQINIKTLHGGNSHSFQAYGGQLNLDLTNYSTGVYVISLIYKNEVIDTKNIIIN